MRCDPRQRQWMLRPELRLALLLMCCIAGCSQTETPVPTAKPTTTDSVPVSSAEVPLRKISALIARRLDLMPGVAQAKWNRKLPITDEKREQALLAKLAAEGTALHIPAEFITVFFQAQITAAKQVQQQAFEEWTARQQPPFASPPDLERDIRPQIDEINGLMLNTLAELWRARTDSRGSAALQRALDAEFQSATWSEDVVVTATKPLRDALAAHK